MVVVQGRVSEVAVLLVAAVAGLDVVWLWERAGGALVGRWPLGSGRQRCGCVSWVVLTVKSGVQ